MSEPVTLEVVVQLLSSIRQHQSENFHDLNFKIDRQNAKLDKHIDDQCLNCTKTSSIYEKINTQWLAIIAVFVWLSAITGYGYVIATEVFRHVGKT